MTQQSVFVQAGTVTTVHPQLAAGATIYNGDANNAVWVSSSPSVAPDHGMRIGPKGSLQWTNNNAPCYACTDANSTDPVTITVSTDIAGLNNPVDIGVAVATQLLAQGVPSVFLGDVIATGTTLPKIGVKNYALIDLDVSRYASLVITLDCPSAQISATCTSGGMNLGSFDFPVTNTNGSITFVMPVTGPKMTLSMAPALDNNTASYMVYGSNRAVQGPRILTGYSQNSKEIFSTDFVSGTAAYFTKPYASNGKPVFLRLVVTGAGSGKFGYIGFGPDGAEQANDLVDSAVGVAGTDGKEVEMMFNLPPGKLQLYFNPTATANYTVVFSLVQEHY